MAGQGLIPENLLGRCGLWDIMTAVICGHSRAAMISRGCCGMSEICYSVRFLGQAETLEVPFCGTFHETHPIQNLWNFRAVWVLESICLTGNSMK
jgi:hypothetical protein